MMLTLTSTDAWISPSKPGLVIKPSNEDAVRNYLQALTSTAGTQAD